MGRTLAQLCMCSIAKNGCKFFSFSFSGEYGSPMLHHVEYTRATLKSNRRYNKMIFKKAWNKNKIFLILSCYSEKSCTDFALLWRGCGASCLSQIDPANCDCWLLHKAFVFCSCVSNLIFYDEWIEKQKRRAKASVNGPQKLWQPPKWKR